jgi:hypothetical protein
MEIVIPATDNETLNLNAIEIVFNANVDEQIGEKFINELLALTTKYETTLSTLTFKENK